MKKLVAVILTLSLMILCVPAFAADYTASGVGTFTLPDSMEIDNSSYIDENTEESVWLFDAFDDDMVLECYNEYLSDYEGVSLFSYTEDELNAYIEQALYELGDDTSPASYTETVRAGQIPFIIYLLDDEGEKYYYAETIANGWCISLTIYSQEGSDLDSELAILKDVLASFTPAV